MDKDKELSSKEVKKLLRQFKSIRSLPLHTPVLHQKQLLKEMSDKDFRRFRNIIYDEFSEEAFTVLYCEEYREKLSSLLGLGYVKPSISLSSMENAPKDLILRRFASIHWPNQDDVDFFVKHIDDIFIEKIEKYVLDEKYILALIKNNRLDVVARYLKSHKGTNYFRVGIELAMRDDFHSIADTYFSAKDTNSKSAFVECIKREDINSILIALDHLCIFNEQIELSLFALNSPNVIYKWIQKMCKIKAGLYNRGQVLLMHPLYKDAIKEYIKVHTICDEAEIKLINLKDEEITSLYISKIERLSPVAEEALFSLYPSKITAMYEMNCGLSLSKEREMIIKNYYPVLNAYISKHELYSQNELLFFKTASEELCLKYIELYDLSDLTDAYLVKDGRTKLVEARVKKCIANDAPLYEKVEVLLFMYRPYDLTIPYLKTFTPKLMDEVLPYLREKHYDILDNVSHADAMTFMGDPKASCNAILLFAKRQGLTSQCWQILIEEKRIDVLSVLFKDYPMPLCCEDTMMKKEYLNIIDEYIKYHDLHNEAEVNFVEIATSDMLRFYLDKYVISLAAERKMIELGLF